MRQVPYVKTIMGDTETPITVFQKYVGEKVGFLLESKSKEKNRFSFIGAEPEKIIRADNKEHTMEILKKDLESYKVVNTTHLPWHIAYPNVSGILLDIFIPGVSGGSGKTFSWDLAKGIPRENVILAGGLSPTNVSRAIDPVRPQVVDVSTGVETDRVKDKGKIIEFIKGVKEHG